MNIAFLSLVELKKAPNQTVVRVQTSNYVSGGRLVTKRTISTLKRKSRGYNELFDLVPEIGADEVISMIINLDEVDDGIYRVIIVNVSTDWETGYIDDYDLKLIPYEEEE